MKIIRFTFFVLWFFLFLFLALSDDFSDSLRLFIQSYGNSSFLIFIFIQLICAFFVLPCSLLTSSAVLIWGFKLGLAISLIAAFLSALATYFFGKFIFRKIGYFKKLTFFKLALMLVKKFNKGIMPALLFMNPLLPGSSLGYVFSQTNITQKRFIFCAFVGIFPLQLLLSFFGSLFYL